ncbi:MAG: hypothetical protein AAGI52_01680 [Bacteroidota bacterium]
MIRFSILAVAVLALSACRTEPTTPPTDDSADSTEIAAVDVTVSDSMSGTVDLPPPSLDEEADETTRTATLTSVMGGDGECFVLATDAEGELLLPGTTEACAQGTGLEGQEVILTQGEGTQSIPTTDGTQEEPVLMIVGIEAAQ